MKQTKKAKKCQVLFIKELVERTYNKYTCPSCKCEFRGFVKENSSRIICDCGQELIVEKVFIDNTIKKRSKG